MRVVRAQVYFPTGEALQGFFASAATLLDV
jgi:hypothetical protein